ncbi:MAG: SRPBCC family protein, partial [Shinella sp.]
MNDTAAMKQVTDRVQEYELDAPPENVWRAISIPAFRERWLPHGKPANAEPISIAAGEEICFRIRDDEPPFLDSIATFQIRP